jgi:hypothetical protein
LVDFSEQHTRDEETNVGTMREKWGWGSRHPFDDASGSGLVQREASSLGGEDKAVGAQAALGICLAAPPIQALHFTAEWIGASDEQLTVRPISPLERIPVM